MSERSNLGHVTAKDGVRIAYRIDGAAGRPWLVLSNSFATTHMLWEPQMTAFSEHYRVLRYDTRGHGASDEPAGPCTFDLLADDIITLMNELGIERSAVVGISLGGMTGLTLALNAPERLNAVICCDARADASDGFKAMWDKNLAHVEEAGIAALIKPTIERWFTAKFRDNPANQAIRAAAGKMIMATTKRGYVEIARCLQGLNILPRLGEIAVPAHFVVGAEDPAAPPNVMAEMAAAMPNASLTEIPDAAHLSNIEQPAAFTKAVTAFLDQTLDSPLFRNTP